MCSKHTDKDSHQNPTEPPVAALLLSALCSLGFLGPALTALAVLVAAVTTVVGSVAHPSAGNAAVVPTLKLGC